MYIHEGRLFVCFVPMVHETEVIMTHGQLLNLKFYIFKKMKLTNSCKRPQVVKMKGMQLIYMINLHNII
jgi:hypothetical protein